jgi:predicted metal-dependent HD superfamily phosphohydrolase
MTCLHGAVDLAERLAGRWPLDDPGPRDALLAAYAAPGRGYHDLRHLGEVLDRLDELAEAGEAFDRLPVELAAWFHDGVYDGAAGDEARSAGWASHALPEAGVASSTVAEVARLVLLTEHHRPDPGDRNGEALSDADLAVLASDAERYDAYVRDVRREYAHVPDDDFRRGRAAVLEDLAAKPSLFHTAHARASWESRARANLARELAALRA